MLRSNLTVHRARLGPVDPAAGVDPGAVDRFSGHTLRDMPCPTVVWEGVATVLFADLRNFTGMVEHREPAAVFVLLNNVHRVLIAAIHEHGGVVDKFLGDGLMATFGVGTALGDHVERAVHAAITMQRRLKALAPAFAKDGWPRVGIGVGLASGRMVAGYVGIPGCVDYTVVGDTVFVASRLTAGAREGEVVLEEGAYAGVAEWLDAEPLGEIQMRGRARPVLVWQVRGL